MKTASPSGSPRFFLAGAAHIDRRALADTPYRPAASNPGRLTDEAGGSVFNAALALRALGAEVAIEGARGGDADGKRIARTISALGCDDLSVTWLDRSTPTYTAILDDKGELVAGVADMALYDKLIPRLFTRVHTRAAMQAADGFLIDANLLPSTVLALAKAAGTRPVGAIGVSPAKVVRLDQALGELSVLFLSVQEAASLAYATTGTAPSVLADLLRERGVRRAVITDGPRDALIIDGDLSLRQRPPSVVAHDVTGAGDTLAGTTMFHLARNVPFLDCVRAGLVAASMRISASAFPPADLAADIELGVAALRDPEELESER